MKTILAALGLFAILHTANAQKEITPRPMNSDKGSYLGVGAGINDATGILGIRFDAKISPKILLGVGAGIGGWGAKISFNAAYQTPSNWNPFVSLTRSTGIDSLPTMLEARRDGGPTFTQKITLQYNPVNTLNLGVQKQWFSRRGNRFFLNLGYAFALNTDRSYLVKTPNTELSDVAIQTMKIIAPGGLIIGLGYQFKLN